MGEIVNLNKVRKARAKAEKKAGATANRGLFGVPKVQKDRAKTEREKAALKLDQSKLDPPSS